MHEFLFVGEHRGKAATRMKNQTNQLLRRPLSGAPAKWRGRLPKLGPRPHALPMGPLAEQDLGHFRAVELGAVPTQPAAT